MGVETAWPNWIDRPILIRLYDLVNDVPVSPEDYKQTLIDAANGISILFDEEENECEQCGDWTDTPGLCDHCKKEMLNIEAEDDEDNQHAAEAAKGE